MSKVDTPEPTPAPAAVDGAWAVYELIDATNDEMYFPIGMFSTFEKARDYATAGDRPPGEDPEDHCRLEVRRHEVNKPFKPSITAGTVEWHQWINEETDEYEWVLDV